MTHNPESLCAQEKYNPVVYSWEDSTNENERPQGIVLRVLNELMKAQEPGYSKYDAIRDGLEKCDDIVRAAVKKVQNRTWLFAEKYYDEKFLYIMGSGASFSQAYGFSICSLQEMQWMDCCYLHSGEYFHGPFECTDKDHLYILLKGTGSARIMDERCEVFLNKYAEKYEIIDAEELGIDAIDESVNEYFCPMVFYAMSVAYRTGLQNKRQHPLDMRRYMGVVEY
jgi:fructoselysine-6-P-deglycase FrlB-like protein